MRTPAPLANALKIGGTLTGAMAAAGMTIMGGEAAIDTWRSPDALEPDKKFMNLLGGFLTFDLPLMSLAGAAGMKGTSLISGSPRFAYTPRQLFSEAPAVPFVAIAPAAGIDFAIRKFNG